MDWAQVLAIVLPVMLTITVGLFYSNRRFDDVNYRISDMREDLHFKYDKVLSDMDYRFTEVHRKFDGMKSDVDQKFADMKADIKEIKGLLLDFLKKEAGV